MIVGDERQEDYDGLEAGWRAEFEPDCQSAESLLRRVILNDWQLQRAERRQMDAEEDLAQTDPLEWTEQQHQKAQLFLRYKTTAERSFYRAYNALKALRKDRMLVEKQLETMRTEMGGLKEEMKNLSKATEQKFPKSRAREIFQGQNSPKKMRKIPILDQWVEIRIRDGQTVTELYPSNRLLIERGKRMAAPPELVYRRLNFPQGVPKEYHWVTLDPLKRKYGGLAIQRMTTDTWLDTIDREKEDASGHIGKTGLPNVPRPKERGVCNCEVCTRNRDALEKSAEE